MFSNLFLLKSFIVIASLFITHSFTPVVIDLSFTYIFVLIVTFRYARKREDIHLIRNAFIVALFSGPIFLLKYDLDPLWFTHKDMSHIFVLLSLVLIYKGLKVENIPA